MSYILDALRRADAERERGAVPDLHAQPLHTATPEAEAPRASPPWLWIALGLLLVAVLLLAWRLLAGGPASAPAASAAVPNVVPNVVPNAAPNTAANATTTPLASTAATPAAAPSTPPALPTQFPSQALSDITPAPPPGREARPAARAETRAANPTGATAATAATTPANPQAAQPASPAPAPTAAAATTKDERVYAIAELPEDVRRSLPALPIGGSTFSQNPASRMLIVNGQVFREGDSITPELKLEQIRLKGAVLLFRGYRYAITF